MGKCKVCGEEVFPDCPELADDTYYCSTKCIRELHNQNLSCESEETISSYITPDDKVRTKNHARLKRRLSQLKSNT